MKNFFCKKATNLKESFAVLLHSLWVALSVFDIFGLSIPEQIWELFCCKENKQ